ncbi:MAG TPA: DUF1761 domain-containing protein [Novosphingobium sp.]|nr:DUF1761 domain-containing protein [Novosphingobium sp.]HNN56160.1 DUF1761 domain-containing protein [Novosphingobium sp.]
MELNWIAIVAAGVAAFLLGGLWYAPPLFGRAWQADCGLSDEQLKQGNMARIFGGALILSVLAAAMFSMFLGSRPELGFAASAGFSAGLFWVAASLGIFYLFERRPLRLWLINGGYATVMFTLIGAVLSLLG